MGRPKEELRRIHHKKIKRAREKIKAYLKGELEYQKLSRLARKLLRKRKKSVSTPTG